MNPRRFLNFFRSPTGALALFLIGLVIVLLLVNSRRPARERVSLVPQKSASNGADNAPQLPETVRRDMVPFETKSARASGTNTDSAATEAAKHTSTSTAHRCGRDSRRRLASEAKKFSADFAPFGRLIPCELVITVDSSSIQTPIIGLVTEDIFHHGQLIIPAGTEVHGRAQVDRARERIASNGRWNLVWQNGQELSVSGLALDHERDPDTGTWGITDGSAGLRGKLLKTDNLAEVKLYVAALLSGAAEAFTDKQISPFGSFALPSLQNAPLKGAQSVLDRYAQQILQAIERDGFYVRVPAGKQFYLYITQTVDEDDAKIGGTLTAVTRRSSTLRPPTPSPAPQRPVLAPGIPTTARLSEATAPCTFRTHSHSMKQLLLIPASIAHRLRDEYAEEDQRRTLPLLLAEPVSSNGLRTGDQLREYRLGRYVDARDPLVMHEGHPVYRVETSARWDLRPNNGAVTSAARRRATAECLRE